MHARELVYLNMSMHNYVNYPGALNNSALIIYSNTHVIQGLLCKVHECIILYFKNKS